MILTIKTRNCNDFFHGNLCLLTGKFREKEKNELEIMIKAIDLDIYQTTYCIKEQKISYNHKKHEKNDNIHDKNEKNHLEKEDKKEFFIMNREETETGMRENIVVLARSYPVDEKLKISEKSYECYACRLL